MKITQSKKCKFCGKTFYRQTWRNDRMWDLQTVCSPDCSVKLEKKMKANFRMSAPDFYKTIDSLKGFKVFGLYAILVAGWDIETYCKAHRYKVSNESIAVLGYEMALIDYFAIHAISFNMWFIEVNS